MLFQVWNHEFQALGTRSSLQWKPLSFEIPSKVPHRFRGVGKASREHGSSVRWSKRKQNWTSHDASTSNASFVIRLKALSIQVNPIDSLRRQPLNYVHNWTSPETIKRKKTTPKVMCLPGNSFVLQLLWQFSFTLEQCGKGMLSQLPAMQWHSRKVVSPRYSGQLFNQTITTGWKPKNGQLFHFT